MYVVFSAEEAAEEEEATTEDITMAIATKIIESVVMDHQVTAISTMMMWMLMVMSTWMKTEARNNLSEGEKPGLVN